MRTIAIVNEKGGTGKTTTSVNLSAALGEMGLKVLLVDLDGQAASSRWLGVEDDTSFADALWSGQDMHLLRDVIPNVSLAPGSGKLDSVAHDLRPTQGGQLRKLLGQVQGFDYAIIDCPPSLGNRLIGNALLASTHAVVPVETSILALDGLKILLTTFQDVRDGFGHEIILLGALACRYDVRTRLSRMILEELRRALPGRVFSTVIRENVRVRECPASGQSILTFAPESHAAEDYRALAKEMVAKIASIAAPGPGGYEMASASLPPSENQSIDQMRRQVDAMLRQFAPTTVGDDEDPTGEPPHPEEVPDIVAPIDVGHLAADEQADAPGLAEDAGPPPQAEAAGAPGDVAPRPAPAGTGPNPDNGIWDLDAEIGDDLEEMDPGEIWGTASAGKEGSADPQPHPDAAGPEHPPEQPDPGTPGETQAGAADAPAGPPPAEMAAGETPQSLDQPQDEGEPSEDDDDEAALEPWQRSVSQQQNQPAAEEIDEDGEDLYREQPHDELADEDLPAHDRPGSDHAPAAEPEDQPEPQPEQPSQAPPAQQAPAAGVLNPLYPNPYDPSAPAEPVHAGPPPTPAGAVPADGDVPGERLAPPAEAVAEPAPTPDLSSAGGRETHPLGPNPFAPGPQAQSAPAGAVADTGGEATDGQGEQAEPRPDGDEDAASDDQYPALRALLRQMQAESGRDGARRSPWRKLIGKKAGAGKSR